MENNIELLAKTVASLLAIASSITIAWKGKNKWEPSEEDLPEGAQRIVGLFTAVSITFLWVVLFDIKYFNYLAKTIIYLILLTFVFLYSTEYQ